MCTRSSGAHLARADGGRPGSRAHEKSTVHSIYGYHGPHKSDFLRITVNIPSRFNKARRTCALAPRSAAAVRRPKTAEMPASHRSGPPIPDGDTGILESGFTCHPFGHIALQTYESNIEYVLRFMVDTKLAGAGWVELPPGAYTVRPPDQCTSHCQIEVDVRCVWRQ